MVNLLYVGIDRSEVMDKTLDRKSERIEKSVWNAL